MEFKSEAERDSKLLFIRQRAMVSFDNEELGKSLDELLIEVKDILPVDEMGTENAGLHIGKIEEAISWLRAHAQGVAQRHYKVREREINEKHLIRNQLVHGSDRKANKLEKLGLDLKKLMAEVERIKERP